MWTTGPTDFGDLGAMSKQVKDARAVSLNLAATSSAELCSDLSYKAQIGFAIVFLSSVSLGCRGCA